MRRALQAVIIAFALLLTSALPAHASVASQMAPLVNSARTAAGLSSLSWSAGLTSVAQAWAQYLAADGQLAHNPSTSSQIPSGWTGWAENVAFHTDPTAQRLHDLLMGSAGHRANILGNFTHIGVGYATTSTGAGYVVEVFAAYSSSDPTPTPSQPQTPDPTPTQSPPSSTEATDTPDDEPQVDQTAPPQDPPEGQQPAPLPDGWLGPGADESDVKHLQADLNELGYTLTIDGVYGTQTTAAVLDFQNREGLVPDGLAGPITLAAVAAELEAVAQEPEQQPTPTSEPDDAAQDEPEAPTTDSGEGGSPGPGDNGNDGNDGESAAQESRPVGANLDPVALVARYALIGVLLLGLAAAVAITLGATRPHRPDYRRMLLQRANDAILKLR